MNNNSDWRNPPFFIGSNNNNNNNQGNHDTNDDDADRSELIDQYWPLQELEPFTMDAPEGYPFSEMTGSFEVPFPSHAISPFEPMSPDESVPHEPVIVMADGSVRHDIDNNGDDDNNGNNDDDDDDDDGDGDEEMEERYEPISPSLRMYSMALFGRENQISGQREGGVEDRTEMERMRRRRNHRTMTLRESPSPFPSISINGRTFSIGRSNNGNDNNTPTRNTNNNNNNDNNFENQRNTNASGRRRGTPELFMHYPWGSGLERSFTQPMTPPTTVQIRNSLQQHSIFNSQTVNACPQFLVGCRVACNKTCQIDETMRHDILKNCKILGAEVYMGYSLEITHFISPFQIGDEYERACSDRKIVVGLQWLEDCISAKRYIEPYKPVVHYSLKSWTGIPGMRGLVISVTGFIGDERNDLKYLIRASGATYSGALQRKENTHLLCSMPEGEKYKKALEWNIKVVNARWIYDCVAQWVFLPEFMYQDIFVNR